MQYLYGNKCFIMKHALCFLLYFDTLKHALNATPHYEWLMYHKYFFNETFMNI